MKGCAVQVMTKKTLSPVPFSRTGSTGSDDNAILKEILNEALVFTTDGRHEDKTPDAHSNCTPPAQVLQAVHMNTDLQSVERRNSGSSRKTRSQRMPEVAEIATLDTSPNTAATKVQKSYRGHRVRLQVPNLKGKTQPPRPLSPVKEETRMVVTFDTTAMDGKEGRTGYRKKTPYIKKEDVPPEENAVEVLISEIPRDEPRWNLRAERKLTGFIRSEDVPNDSDTESDTPS